MFKKFGFYALSLVVLASMTVFQSCKEDEEPAPTQTIWEIVQSTDGLDSLEKYLEIYELDDDLNIPGTSTFFAPSNDAFEGLLETPGFPSDIESINPDIITFVLLYHLVQEIVEAPLTAGAQYNTRITNTVNNPEDVIIVNPDGTTLLTGSSNSAIAITTANLRATNGIVHITSSVLVPPSVGASLTPILGTNAGTLLLGAPFSILAQGIQKADAFAASQNPALPTLTSILAGSVTNTVFAPTNDTFNGATPPITVDTFTGQEWYGIIANHVVLADVAPADLINGYTMTTAAAGTLFTINTPSIPPMNGVGIYLDSNGDFDPGTGAGINAEIALPDAAINSNGRVHIIAGVLSPN